MGVVRNVTNVERRFVSIFIIKYLPNLTKIGI